MTTFFGDPVAVWAAVLIVVLPLLIVGAGEVQERLRQRTSPFEKPVATLRTWLLPLVALWVLLVLVADVGTDNFFIRVLATAIVLSIVAVCLQAIALVVALAKRRSEMPGARSVPQLVLLLPRLLVILVAAWLIVQTIWSVDISGLFAALGVTSLVISLALQPTLSGIASGLLLLGDRPFEPGDWIRAGDLEGQVVDLSWRTSKVRTRDGDIVIIPNGKLSDATLYNFAEPTRLHRVVVPVQVAYSNPPTVAKEMLLAAARATPGVLEDPPPSIRVVQIDDPLMGYEADLWIDDYAIAPRVFSDFGSLVWYHSDRMGVPLPSPAYDLYHHDPVQEAADTAIGPAEVARRLRSVPIMAQLTTDDIELLAGSASVLRYSRGEEIVSSSARDTGPFVLWEGAARIEDPEDRGRSIDVTVLEVFGLVGRSLPGGVRPRVVALTDCIVIALDADDMGVVASRDQDLADVINKVVANRLRRLGALSSTAPGGDDVDHDTSEAT